MAKRQGFFRRLVRQIVRRQPPSPPKPPPRPTPATRRSALINKVVDHIIRSLPLSNRARVRARVEYMDDEELQWTLDASIDQLKWRARQDADRITSDRLPLNPWWYH